MQQKKTVDMTQGSITKTLLLFAVPIFLSNLFQQLYNTVDSVIVGKFLGNNALAAVSTSGNIIFMFVSFFNGIAMGAGVAIAKFFGAKDEESVDRAIHTDFALGLVFGVLLTALGVTLTPFVLSWVNTDAEVMPNAVAYFRVYFSGVIFSVLYNICVGILHALGDSKHPLYYLIASSLVNVALDLLFVGVFGDTMGVGGAAFATLLSQALSFFLCVVRLTRLDAPYRLQIKKIRFHKDMLKLILRYGIPGGIQNSVIGFANTLVLASINSFGKEASAGYGSYVKIEGFAFLPITCFAMGISTFISQNLGAGLYDRAKKCARIGITCSLVLSEIIGVLFFVFAPQMIGIFVKEGDVGYEEILRYGVTQARTESLFFFLLAFAHCVAGVCRGAGKPVVPMVIMLSIWCVLRIAYITVILQFIPEVGMVYWAYPITWGISSVIYLVYYLKSDWVHGFDRKHPREKVSVSRN